SLIDKEGRSAKARHSGFKSQAGAQRRHFKKHHHHLAGERLAEVSGPRLHQRGKVQHGFDFARTEVAARHQVARPEVLRRQRLRSGCAFYGLDAQFFLLLLDFPVALARATSRAPITSSTCFFWITYGGKNRNTVSCVRLIKMPRSNNCCTADFAVSAWSISSPN